MTTNEMLQEIVVKISANIVTDTVLYGSAESASKFQFNQLVESGMSDDIANVVIEMALSIF